MAIFFVELRGPSSARKLDRAIAIAATSSELDANRDFSRGGPFPRAPEAR
jgi:hypothetical protein